MHGAQVSKFLLPLGYTSGFWRLDLSSLARRQHPRRSGFLGQSNVMRGHLLRVSDSACSLRIRLFPRSSLQNVCYGRRTTKCPIAKQAPISTRRGSMPYRRHDYKAFSADLRALLRRSRSVETHDLERILFYAGTYAQAHSFIQNALQAQQNLHHAARSTDPQHQQHAWEAIDGILSIQGSSAEERRDWWRRSQCSITRALGLVLPAALTLPFPLPPWGSPAHAALTPRTPRRRAHQTLSASSHRRRRRRGSSSSRSHSHIPPLRPIPCTPVTPLSPGSRAELIEVETLLLCDGASNSDDGPFFSFPPTPAVRPPSPSRPVPPTLAPPVASPAHLPRSSAERQSAGVPLLLIEESDKEEDGSPARNTLFLTAEEPEFIAAFAGLTLSTEPQADEDTATDSSDEEEDAEAARARQAKRAGKQKAREPSGDEHAQLQKDDLALLQREQEAADAETACLLQMAEHVRTAHPLPFAFGDAVPMGVDEPDSIALQLQQHFDAAALERGQGKGKEAGKDVEKGRGKEKQCQRLQSSAEAGPSIPPLTEEEQYAISVTLEFEFARLQDVFRLGYPIILTHDIADFLEDHPLPRLEVCEEVESCKHADDPRLQRARTDAATRCAQDNDAIERNRAARENSEAGRALREAAAEQARVRAARVARGERWMELMEARDFRRQQRALRQQRARNCAKKARRKARCAREEEQRLRDQRGQEGDDKMEKAKASEQEEPERDEAGKEEPKENEGCSGCKEEGMDAAGQEESRETEGRNSCEEEGMDGAGGYSEGESDLTPLSSSDCVPVPHAVSLWRLCQRIPISYCVGEFDSESAQTDPSPSAPYPHGAPSPDPGSSTSSASDSSSSEPKKKPKKKKKSKRKWPAMGIPVAELQVASAPMPSSGRGLRLEEALEGAAALALLGAELWLVRSANGAVKAHKILQARWVKAELWHNLRQYRDAVYGRTTRRRTDNDDTALVLARTHEERRAEQLRVALIRLSPSKTRRELKAGHRRRRTGPHEPLLPDALGLQRGRPALAGTCARRREGPARRVKLRLGHGASLQRAELHEAQEAACFQIISESPRESRATRPRMRGLTDGTALELAQLAEAVLGFATALDLTGVTAWERD
ncbi:hypothetical protein FB451DRAFT_1182381 [Mycena latifolia]|nr:hypothetical protein FB451DRAFT_1182381 [Mycena latifolia]